MTGIVLTSVGGLFIWSGLPHTELLICHQNQVRRISCEKKHKVLWGLVLSSVPLDNVQSVRLGLGENTESDSAYRLDLFSHQKTLEFGRSLSQEQVKADLAQTQTFIANPFDSPLYLERFHQAWGFVILGLPIAGLGLEIIRYQFINTVRLRTRNRQT